MSQDLSVTAPVVPGRVDAMHQVGHDVTGSMTAKEALEKGGLANWNVRTIPLQTAPVIDEFGVHAPVDVPGNFASIRNRPGAQNGEIDVFGVVGSKYTHFQNEDQTTMLDAIVDVAGANFDNVGQLRGGRQVFVSMKLPKSVLVGGVDPMDMYLTSFNSHDGSTALRVALTQIRVFCANQQNAVMKNNHGIFTVRHTRNAMQAVATAREVLGLSYAYNEEFEQAAERLIQTTMTDAQFVGMMNQLWEAPDVSSSKVSKTKHANRMESLQSLFHDSPTNANIRGTAWAAYQTVTEFTDHFANVKLNGHSATATEARATQVLSGSSTRLLKEKAFDLALAAV